jgi:hypothetical protein
MGESFGPMQEDEHDVSILGEPFPLNDDGIALAKGYAVTRSEEGSGSIVYVPVKTFDALLFKMGISDDDVDDRYQNHTKASKIRYLIDVNPDFRRLVLTRTLTPKGVESLIIQTGKGRQVGKGKKVRAALRSGMFGTTHKKMVHQPIRSYRNQLI